MTRRKYLYRRVSAEKASRRNDELLFCLDRPSEEFENGALWCMWRVRMFDGNEYVASIWHRYKDEVLEQWTKEFPGTRPRCYWVYSAPTVWIDQPPFEERWRTPFMAICQRLDASPEVKLHYLARHNELTAGERKVLAKQLKAIPPTLKVIEND